MFIARFFIVAAFVMTSSPAFVTAQDFFFSFDENSRAPTQTLSSGTTSSTAYIFFDVNFDFNQLDLNFGTDNSGVVAITGGRVHNPGAAGSGTQPSAPGGFFTSLDLDQLTPSSGRLFATSFLGSGVPLDSNSSNFREGANGFLLAEVDFDIIRDGTANFAFDVGRLGVINDGIGRLTPTLGTGSLTVEAVPEPSSAVLLILGASGMVARRRRA